MRIRIETNNETQDNARSFNPSFSGQYPRGWKIQALKDVCEFLDYLRKPVNELERVKRISGKKQALLYPYYGANGQVGWIDDFLFAEPLILLAEDGGYFGSYEKPIAYAVEGKYWVNNHAHVLRPTSEINIRFLFHSLRIRPDIAKLVSGTTRLKLSQEIASSIPLLVPPMDDQIRIATILDEKLAAVDEAKKAAGQQLASLDDLIFNLIEKSLHNSNHEIKVADCFSEVKQGIGSTWKDYPLYGATREGLAPAKEGVGKKPERYKPANPGTILYNPMRINIGSIAILNDDDPPGITSPDYVVINAKEGVIHPLWFYHWLRSYMGQNFIRTLARGAVRERMLFTQLAKGKINLPDYQVQAETAEKLRQISLTKKKISEQLDLIQKLPQAYLRQAFRGEL